MELLTKLNPYNFPSDKMSSRNNFPAFSSSSKSQVGASVASAGSAGKITQDTATHATTG